MEILKIEGAAKRTNGFASKFLALGLLVVAGLGTTLAGQITTNSNQNIEFGQAVARTASCDTNGGITIAPTAQFANVANSTGTFNLGTITITGIDDTCAGRTFTIKGYDDSSQTPLNLVTPSGGTPQSSIFFSIAANGGTPSSGVNVRYVPSSGNNRIEVGPASGATTVSATQVMKLTIESSAS